MIQTGLTRFKGFENKTQPRQVLLVLIQFIL